MRQRARRQRIRGDARLRGYRKRGEKKAEQHWQKRCKRDFR
jgi:hypothetical protein